MARLSFGHVLMLVAGLLAALVNYSVLRAGDDPEQVALVARDLRAGDTIDPADLTFTTVDAGADLLSALVSREDTELVAGQVLAVPLAEGEPLRRADLRPPSSDSGLRAMSLALDPARAVGGSLRPGDRVDVVHATDGSARYLATDLEVLAAGETATDGPLTGLGPSTVTLAVDADTALLLAAAAADELQLVRATGADRDDAAGAAAVELHGIDPTPATSPTP